MGCNEIPANQHSVTVCCWKFALSNQPLHLSSFVFLCGAEAMEQLLLLSPAPRATGLGGLRVVLL